MRKPPQSIKNILSRRPDKSPLMRQVRAAMVLEMVKEFLIKEFGDKVLDKARPMYVKDKILNIACLSSVLSQEIRYKEQDILKLVNEEFGKNTVERVRYIQ
jgi:predicted nucleic acid-binding Zn ribbon protein